MKTLKKIAALITAGVLVFSFSAFSQDTTTKDKGGKKMHIKIEIEKDGKTTKVDTTINPEELAALNEHLKQLDINIGSPADFPMLHSFKFNGDEKEWEEHMRKLEQELEDKEINMEDFQKQMEAMYEKMKDHHQMFQYKYKTYSDSDKQLLEIERELDKLDNMNMNFNFNNDGKKKTITIEGDNLNIYGDDLKIDGDDVKIKSDDGKKEIIIKSKTKPDGKDGKRSKERESKKVIIIMKSSVTPEKQKAEFAAEPTNENQNPTGTENANRVRVVEGKGNPWFSDLSCYPNPSVGEFTVSLRLNNPEAAELKIMDMAGREVFAENIPENTEWVEKQIKLPSNSSAAYLLILRQGNNWHHEKIFVKS